MFTLNNVVENCDKKAAVLEEGHAFNVKVPESVRKWARKRKVVPVALLRIYGGGEDQLPGGKGKTNNKTLGVPTRTHFPQR